MTKATVTVEQRHRDEAVTLALYFYSDAKRAAMQQGEADDHPFVQAFARFDTERNATLEREIAALREALQYIHDRPFPHPNEATFYLETIRRVARNALGGQPS